jgi:hypothetical protein
MARRWDAEVKSLRRERHAAGLQERVEDAQQVQVIFHALQVVVLIIALVNTRWDNQSGST